MPKTYDSQQKSVSDSLNINYYGFLLESGKEMARAWGAVLQNFCVVTETKSLLTDAMDRQGLDTCSKIFGMGCTNPTTGLGILCTRLKCS
jgi:hypothetical protein